MGVQGTRRLVAEHDGRLFGQGPGNGNPLLLPPGQLCGKMVHLLTEVHQLHGLGRVHGLRSDLSGDLYVFHGREGGNQVIELKHKADFSPAVFGELTVVHDR